jgi:hypothetical protein
LEYALKNHRSETYWLTRNSCATAVIDMLIAGIRLHQERFGTKDREDSALALIEANQSLAGMWDEEKSDSGVKKFFLKRKFLAGLLVNPFMSFPAKLPTVLQHRGFLKSASTPDEIYGPEGEQKAPKLKPTPSFLQEEPSEWDMIFQ